MIRALILGGLGAGLGYVFTRGLAVGAPLPPGAPLRTLTLLGVGR